MRQLKADLLKARSVKSVALPLNEIVEPGR